MNKKPLTFNDVKIKIEAVRLVLGYDTSRAIIRAYARTGFDFDIMPRDYSAVIEHCKKLLLGQLITDQLERVTDQWFEAEANTLKELRKQVMSGLQDLEAATSATVEQLNTDANLMQQAANLLQKVSSGTIETDDAELESLAQRLTTASTSASTAGSNLSSSFSTVSGGGSIKVTSNGAQPVNSSAVPDSNVDSVTGGGSVVTSAGGSPAADSVTGAGNVSATMPGRRGTL